MVQRTWTEADLSAYIDGQMAPAQRADLEASLAQDGKLQRQIEGIRQVKMMLRDLPLSEPPRNYLLTPSMVQESSSKVRRQRTPLLAMRWVTALTTAAFALTLGLNLLVQVPAPASIARDAGNLGYSAEVAEPEVMVEAVEVTVEVEAPQPAAEPVAKAAAPEAEAATSELSQAESEESALLSMPAPLPDEAAGAEADDQNTTGTAEGDAARAVDSTEAQPEENQAVALMAGPEDVGATEAVPEASSGADEYTADSVQATELAPVEPSLTREQSVIPLSVPIVLGSVALPSG